MKWCRLYYEFAHDPKIQIMSETLQRRFVMLMCIQTEGLLPGLSDREVGHVLGLSPAKLNETKQVFLERNLIKNDWTLKNFEKRQFLSDDVTERVRKHRTNKINDNGKNETLPKRYRNVTVTAPDTDTDTDTDTESDTDTEQKKRIKREENAADFERFWTAYKMKAGRFKGGKQEALDLWRKLPDAEKKLAFDLLPEYKMSKEWISGFMVQPVRYIRRKYWEGLPQKNCSRCDGKGWYYREWSDDATGRSMKRQKQPCDKCGARPEGLIDYDTVELIT